jgi:MraZ protein
VAERFRGSIPQKVDAKGRVSVPASFRRVIEACDPRFGPDKRPEVLIYFGDHRRSYVECFTMQAANEIDAQIDMMPRGTPERARMEELFYSNSQTFTVDDDGRIILPQFLRDRIRLGNEAYFVATGDRFRIWDSELYAAEGNRATTSWLDAQPDEFDPFSVLPPLPRSGPSQSGAS